MIIVSLALSIREHTSEHRATGIGTRENTNEHLAPGLGHNEIVVNGHAWEEALPGIIDAIFFEAPGTEENARRIHRAFLAQYPAITEADVPLVRFDAMNWERPFSLPGQ